MTRKLAITSQKGGVGKTTVAINLGYALSRLRAKVLQIDTDPQGGVGTVYRLPGINRKGLVQVLSGEATFEEVALPVGREGISVVSTGISNLEDMFFFEEQVGTNRLGEVLGGNLGNYDFVIFDSPVGFSPITREVLSVSDSLLQVVNCRADTVKSVSNLLNLYIWIRKNVNPGLKFEGILINMFNPAIEQEGRIIGQLKAKLPEDLFFSRPISFDPVFESAGLKGLPVDRFSSGKIAARSFRELADEVDKGKHQFVGDLLAGIEQEMPLGEQAPEEISPDLGEHGDKIRDFLGEMCEKAGFYGAVVADEMGFPLADYRSPVSVDVLATYSSMLGEVLIKAGSIMELHEANNLTMDINDSDKILLNRFSIMDDQYVLVIISPAEIEAYGEINLAMARITTALS